jgi:protein-tyrosine-phosphatase
MLGEMLADLAEAEGTDWAIRTAGTHVVEGQAISPRTLSALQAVDDLSPRKFTAHRSHQLTDEDVEWADAILCAEADHVAYVRARYRERATCAVTIGAFVRHAPLGASFAEQVLTVATMEMDDTLDVPDPAGGDQDDYDRCAQTLWQMAQAFVVLTVEE